ncbi:MAG: hypothetical protein FWH47_08045, partial [Methanomassiliicoccaceae archaeon]|nr:hypothetical protein [Methanomassiliicoccaceae archaeon]
CYHLRMHKRGHENVPIEVLGRWAEDIPWETMTIEHVLQIFAEIKRNPRKLSLGELERKAGTVQGLKGYEIEYRLLSMDDM